MSDDVTIGRIKQVFRADIPPARRRVSKYQALSDAIMRWLAEATDKTALEVPIEDGDAHKVREALVKLWARQGVADRVQVVARCQGGCNALYVMRAQRRELAG